MENQGCGLRKTSHEILVSQHLSLYEKSTFLSHQKTKVTVVACGTRAPLEHSSKNKNKNFIFHKVIREVKFPDYGYWGWIQVVARETTLDQVSLCGTICGHRVCRLFKGAAPQFAYFEL